MKSCELPQPEGWYCSRRFEHGGPCALHRVTNDRDTLLEAGRQLASARESLIAAGVDPADLVTPLAPIDCDEHDGQLETMPASDYDHKQPRVRLAGVIAATTRLHHSEALVAADAVLAQFDVIEKAESALFAKAWMEVHGKTRLTVAEDELGDIIEDVDPCPGHRTIFGRLKECDLPFGHGRPPELLDDDDEEDSRRGDR